MDLTDDMLRAKSLYFCLNNYSRAMQLAAVEGIRKHGGSVLKFYFGFSLLLENRYQEAIRELDRLQNDPDVGLGSIIALLHCHKKCQTVDREAITVLESKLAEDKKFSEKALFFAGVYLLRMENFERAKGYANRILKLNSNSLEGLILEGWIELLQLKDGLKETLHHFDQGLVIDAKNMLCLLGKARYYQARHDFDKALEVINQSVVFYPSFSPPFIEKMKIQLAIKDWDQASDTANRLVMIEPHCIEVQIFRSINFLCREGIKEDTLQQIQTLSSELDRYEPKNAQLYLSCAQLLSYLCGKNIMVLQLSYKMAEKAMLLDPGNSEYMTELGNQVLRQGKVAEAAKHFKKASKLDETYIPALIGIIQCQILEDELEPSEQRLQLLKEMEQNLSLGPDFPYLNALLSIKKKKPADICLNHIVEAVDQRVKSCRSIPFGTVYLLTLNPYAMVELVKLFLKFAPDQPRSVGEMVPVTLKKSLEVTETVLKACPGHIDALYLQAKIKYLIGDIPGATSILQNILDNIDSTLTETHLLMAQIQLHSDNITAASQSLEVGLSYNFEVRDHPIYHLIKAKISKKEGQLVEAMSSLRKALSLSGLRVGSGFSKRSKIDITLNDQVSIYLELIETLSAMKNEVELLEVVAEAQHKFYGTSEEIRLYIANADLALARGNIDEAINILKRIGPEQAYYLQAREKMANIYLNERKDKKMYAQCYREVVEKCPTPQSYLMLGDAYMAITEPERAIEVYEQALKRNPRDSTLACKVGTALTKTHQYSKAINYYKEAIKHAYNVQLRYDLAELQMKLKQYDKAEKTIMQAIEALSSKSNELSSMKIEAKLRVLLGQIEERAGRLEKAILALQQAKDVQSRVLKRVMIEEPDSASQNGQLAASICRQMAEHSVRQRETDKGIRYYKEALMFDPSDPDALLALAKLYMQVGDLDQCQYTCMKLLKTDKDNDSGSIMMADLAFRKNDYETAMVHFQQLLDRRPDHYPALSRLVEVMKRTGHLEEAATYLEKSENFSSRSTMEPGYNYCRGLYEWYIGNPNQALKGFNKARKDPEWGQKSLQSMIEICLNPDNDTIGGETFESMDADFGQHENKDARDMALLTAEKLLKELKPQGNDEVVQYQILSNMAVLYTKQKSSIERALQELTQISSVEAYKDNVAAILGIAIAYMLLKQTPRARNQLKRVAKNTWTFEDSESLEKCWLLLSDIYIQSGKYDMATELLKRVLQHNKSCTKAYEYMGFIMEKEQAYKDAAFHYEHAWKYGNRNSPAIGYKLAFNYMKAKRYTDAIDVCHLVIANHPNYPKIRKEILDKSRNMLKS